MANVLRYRLGGRGRPSRRPPRTRSPSHPRVETEWTNTVARHRCAIPYDPPPATRGGRGGRGRLRCRAGPWLAAPRPAVRPVGCGAGPRKRAAAARARAPGRGHRSMHGTISGPLSDATMSRPALIGAGVHEYENPVLAHPTAPYRGPRRGSSVSRAPCSQYQGLTRSDRLINAGAWYPALPRADARRDGGGGRGPCWPLPLSGKKKPSPPRPPADPAAVDATRAAARTGGAPG